ncbi:MAG: hypothetical protein PHI35_06775, partial [Victivallaceae bacterium]|nr:hypothetical protein [Victivallaceae bacterium]
MMTGIGYRRFWDFGMMVIAMTVLLSPLAAGELLWTGGGPLSARSFHDFSDGANMQTEFLAPEQGGPAVRFKFQPASAASRFVRSDSIALPKCAEGVKRMIRLSGRAVTHDAAFQRLQVKMMVGKRGTQYFCEPAIDFAGPAALRDGRFSQVWTVADDDLALNIFAVADGKGTGVLDLSDLKLELLPYDEALLFRDVPESGLLLYDLAASSSRLPGSNASSMKIEVAKRGILVDFGVAGKPSKSLVFNDVSLPYVRPGTRLKVSAECRGIGFNGRRLELKPLIRHRNGEAFFIPPYPTMPHSGDFGKLSAEWPIDAKVAGVGFYLAADGDTTGKIELSDFKIELLPSELAAIHSGYDFNVIPHDSAKLKVEPARADKFTGGEINVFDESGKKLFSMPLTASGVEIKLAEPGFYRINVAAHYSDRASAVVTDSSAVVAGEPLPDEVLSRSRFGAVNLSGSRQLARSVNSRWEWNFTGLAGASKGADGKISPAPEWRFPKPDFVDAIYTLGNMPAFLQPPNMEKVAIWKPTDPVLYDKVIQEMARSRNFPRYFTVFNEPEGKWRGTVDDFVQWHRDTARAIKKVKPETQVLGPGLCSVNMPLIKRYDKAGLFRYLAGVNVHPYVDGTAPEDEFITKVDEMEAYFKSTGRSKYPIFYTEFGWTTGRGGWQKPVDEATQMRYV